jgi:Protein of unknown function (DUF1091)
MYFKTVAFRCNPDVLSNCSYKVFNDSDGLSRFNASFSTKQALVALTVSYVVKLKTKSREYDFVINKGSADACNVERGVKGNLLIKYMMDSLDEQTSNFRFRCVLPPGFYYYHNFPVPDIRYVPRFIASRQEWEFTMDGRAKINGSKSSYSAGSLKLTGSLI